MIESKSLKVLEYDLVLSKLSEFAYSGMAKKFIMQSKPAQSLQLTRELLEETSQADKILYEHCVSPSFAFDDITEAIESARKMSTLSISNIIRIGRVLKVARNFKTNISKINDNSLDLMQRMASNLYINNDLEQSIYKSFYGDSEVSDDASLNLKTIRQNIRNCNTKIKQKLASYISQSKYSSILQDNVVTMRSNRYVIPVKSEYKGQISGLIHDQSSSGATLFVEPMVVVELNNELRTYELQEKQEIANILAKFTYDICQEVECINESFNLIIKLDSIFARAYYSKSIKAINPTINDKNIFKIINGRHPLISPDKVVPVNVSLGEDYKVIVITGPNTGGKTVTLKLAGLLTLMAMSGIFIPAQEGSQISFFDNIFCDIGDEQSIEQSLSTFSSHMANLTHICDNISENSLILLDELGAGTDPVEGSALAVATIDYFREVGCLVMTTSHYNELKEYSFVTPSVKNASMDFNPITFEPTYKLLIGLSGNSNALQIARRLGLNPDIIANAKSRFSKEKINFDSIIAGAEKARREAEDLRKQAKDELEQSLINSNIIECKLKEIENAQEKLNAKLSKGLKELLSDYNWEAEELMEELKEKVKQGDEKALFEARTIKKKLSDINLDNQTQRASTINYDDSAIKVGDKVHISSLNNVGEVASINDKRGEYCVKVGILTTNIKQSDAKKIFSSQKIVKTNTVIRKEFSNIPCPMEINLLGQNCDEAIYNVEQYLSDAVMHGYNEVRIVHGKGTGVLRKALHEHFKGHSMIASFRLGKYGEGENGVTIVTLK